MPSTPKQNRRRGGRHFGGRAQILFALQRSIPAAMVASALYGMCGVWQVVTLNTTLQFQTPDELRGRGVWGVK